MYSTMLSMTLLLLQRILQSVWLQRTERAALACEIAAQGMEEACEELEKASEVHSAPLLIRTIHATVQNQQSSGCHQSVKGSLIARYAHPPRHAWNCR